MAGKKVFTKTGEVLADFLIGKKKNDQQEVQLDSVLQTINNNVPNVLQDFESNKNMSKTDIISFFETELRKDLENLKVTDGQKEIHLQEMVQKLYNATTYHGITTEAQFIAMTEVYSLKLADIIKTIGQMNRSYQVADTKLNRSIAELIYRPLDYFLGGKDDKPRMYYRFSGSKLLISNGIADNQKFHEVFRTESITNPNQTAQNPAESTIGNKLYLGYDPQFKDIILTKPTTVQGNLTLDGGELLGTAIKARYADLAEYYTTDKNYNPGTLLMISSGDTEAEINDGTSTFLGIVSDKPGFILNEEVLENSIDKLNLGIPSYKMDKPFVCPIVLTGKSPIKTHSQLHAGGKINKGDVLFPSPFIKGAAIAVAFKDSYRYEHEAQIKPIGIVLIGAEPMVIDNFMDASNTIQMVYAKIN